MVDLASVRAAQVNLRVKEIKASSVGPLIAAFDRGQPIRTPDRYDRLTKEAFIENVVGYLCVMLVADAVASLKLDLFQGDTELSADHPAAILNRRQNPITRGRRWWRDLVAYHRLAGNAYIESVRPRDRAPPKELWILRPDRMEIIGGADGMPEGYKYEVNGGKRTFLVDMATGPVDLLHLKEFHPLNDWYGLSPITPAARYIDMDNNASDLNIAMLQNGALPGGLLSFKQALDKEQKARTEASIRNLHSGPRNAGRMLVLGGDWSYTAMAQTMADMQWAEGLDHAARRICAAWNVPHVLVVPGESTYANREAARLEFWEHTVLPYAEMLLGDFNPWLADQFDHEGLEFRIDYLAIGALQLRRLAVRKEAREDYKAGGITLNEWREEIAYGAIENGDQVYQPPVLDVAKQGQEFQAGEAEKGRQFTAAQAEAGHKRVTKEAAAVRAHSAKEADKDRKLKERTQRAKPGRKAATGGDNPGTTVPFDGKAEPGLFAALRVHAPDAAKLHAWAVEQGVRNPVPADQLHVTTVYSTAPVPGYQPAELVETNDPGTFELALLGDGSALVILLESPLARARHDAAAKAGATWAWAAFAPHVTLSYDARGFVPPAAPPFSIDLGPEYAEPLEPAGKHATPLQTKVAPGDYEGLPDGLDDSAMAAETVPVVRDVLRHFGNKTALAINLEIGFDVRSRRMEEFLARFAGERIKELVGTTTRAALAKALAAVTAAGPTFSALVTAVRDTFEIASKDRAEVIARTETTRAAGAGAQEAMTQGEVERKMWLCVVGDTRVAALGVSYVARRPYAGPFVQLHTAGGRVVTVTPEHRILTRRGWVEAKAVTQGDDLISYHGGVEGPPPAAGEMPHVDHVPPMIQETFDALHDLAARPGMMPRLVHLDRHGVDGEVEVVTVNGDLLRHIEPACDEGSKQRFLELSDLRFAELLSDSAASQGLFGKTPPHSLGRHAPAPGQGSRAFIGAAAFDDLRLSWRTAGASVIFEKGLNLGRGAPVLSGEDDSAFPTGVGFGYDRCLRIEVFTASCHVYDYSTANGWMIGNGLVIHNSSRDAFVRDTHAALDGQIVPADGDFKSPSGAHGPHPGALGSTAAENVNCRCVSIALPDEKAAADLSTKEARDAAWAGYEDDLDLYEALMTTAIRAGFAAQERKMVALLTQRLGSGG